MFLCWYFYFIYERALAPKCEMLNCLKLVWPRKAEQLTQSIKPKSQQWKFTNILETLTKHSKIKFTVLFTKPNQRKMVTVKTHFEVSFKCLDLKLKVQEMQTKLSRDMEKKFLTHLMGFLFYAGPISIHLKYHTLYLSTDRNGPAIFSSSRSRPAIQLSHVQSLMIGLSENLC